MTHVVSDLNEPKKANLKLISLSEVWGPVFHWTVSFSTYSDLELKILASIGRDTVNCLK